MTDISSPSQQFFQRLTRNGYAQGLPQSTMLENFDANLSMTMYENMSNSRSRIMKSYNEHNTKVLLKAVEDGVIPQDVFAGFRDSSDIGFNQRLLIRYAKKHYPQLDVQTDEEIHKNIREDLVLAKEGLEDLRRRAGFGGKVAGVVGSMVPYALDPVLLPTYFIGYGEAAAGVKFLAGFGKFLTANAAAESAAEVFRYGWKKDVSEASIEDSIKTVLLATGMVGGIGIAAHLLGRGIIRFLRRGGFTTEELEAVGKTWAEHKVAQMAKEMEAAPLAKQLAEEAKPLTPVEMVEEALVMFEKRFGFRPKINILEKPEDATGAIRTHVLKMVEEGKAPKGVHSGAGKTKGFYLIAQNHKSPWDVFETIYHESIGHEYFSNLPQNQIDELWSKYGEEVKKQYYWKGKNEKFARDRAKGIEEYLVRDLTSRLKDVADKEPGSIAAKVKALSVPQYSILAKYKRMALELNKTSVPISLLKKATGLPEKKIQAWLNRQVELGNAKLLYEGQEIEFTREFLRAQQKDYLSAVEHAKALQAELEHQNSVHLTQQVRNVTQEPDLTKGINARELPESLKPKKEGATTLEAEAEPAITSAKLEPGDALDIATDRILKENPNLEIPERVELTGGAEEVISRKASEIFKELDSQAELANKFKECLIG